MPNRIIRDSAKLSPTLAELSGDEERLFWRLITVADDYGRFIAQPQIIKSLCFPVVADRIRTEKVEAWFDHLVTCQLVTTYVVNGQRYGFFTNWEKHQRVRAKESRFPAPTADNICQHVLSNVAVVGIGNEVGNEVGNGNGNGRQKAADDRLAEPGFGVGEVVEQWNQIPGVVPMQHVTGPIGARILVRLREHPVPTWWMTLFERVGRSDFLCGRKTDFAATLDWILSPKNLAKIVQGNYDNRASPAVQQQAAGVQAFLRRGT